MKLSLWKGVPAKNIILLQQTIRIDQRNISYTLVKSTRAKHMRITINREGEVRVIIPQRVSTSATHKLIVEKSAWILSKIDYMRTLPAILASKNTQEEYHKHKDIAHELIEETVKKYNTFYNFTYKNIRIKNQKTLWGSCSRQGTLNFNYKLALIKEQLRDYVVVHELCHLKEFNHSPLFWNQVAKTIPNHKELRKELKSTGLRFK